MFKRFVKITLIATILLLLVGIAYAWWGHARLERRIALIKEAGDPVSIAELAPPADVAPEDNAAVILARVEEAASKMYVELAPHAHSEDFSWERGLSETQITNVEQTLEAFPDVLPAFVDASQCTTLAGIYDYDVAPTRFMESLLTGEIRTVIRLEDCYARYLASTGKPEEAVEAYLRVLRLAKLHQSEPTLVSFLVNIALRGVAINGLNGIFHTADLESITYQKIEQELSAQDNGEHFVHTLKTERVFGIESFRSLSGWLGLLKSQWINYLDYMEHQIALGAQSEYQLQEVKELEARGLTVLVQPAVFASRSAMNRSRARLRCLRILNAIYSLETMSDTVDLESLGLPSDALVDPYSGKMLLTKSTPRGWLVYSVGKNKNDDEGQIGDSQLDFGVGPLTVPE